MNILAIIPARSGSKGLKNKNIADVCGRPLIDYTIKAAINSNCFETVMVSTDSEEYAAVSKKCGAEVPFLRSELTSSDTAGTWDVVREVLAGYLKIGKEFDYVAVLQPTSPLRNENDIRNAVKLLQNENVKSVVSVTKTEHPIQWCFPLDSTASMREYANSPYNMMRRQDLEKHYQENGAMYFVDAKKIMLSTYNYYIDNCYAYVMPRERSADVDGKLDLIFIEAILRYNENCREENV